MKKRLTVKLLILLLLPFLSGPFPICAQVDIIRKPPATDIPRGEATWSEPYPDPLVVRETGNGDINGMISVGGQGGQNQDGDNVYDVVTDSFFTLVQPLGGEALFVIDAKLLRKSSSVQDNNNYKGALSLEFERLQFKTTGEYKQTEVETPDVKKNDSEGQVSAKISSGLLETMPMSLEYQSTWIDQSDDVSQIESSRTDELDFDAAGTMKAVGVELSGNLEHEEDNEEESESLGSSGNLKILFPLGQRLGLDLLVSPVYSRSKTASYDLSSTNLESGIGLNWPRLNDELQARVHGGRIDAWSDGSGIDYESYQSSWKGGLSLDYQPPEGFFIGPSYGYTKAVGGNQTHDIQLFAGWHNRDVLKEISAKGISTLIRSDTGRRVKDSNEWMLKTALLPADNMNLNSDYNGGYLWYEGEESWNHKMLISFSHAPVTNLNYRGAYTFSNNQTGESENLYKQQYLAGMMIRPMIGFKVYSVEVSEILDVGNGSTDDDILSSAELKASVPLGAVFSTQFGFQWEWINRITTDDGPGNYLHYSAGLLVAGDRAPFSLTARYGFGHGYRGIRHDISSDVRVPLRRGYSLDSSFSLSHYDNEGESLFYWLLGLNLVYQF